MDYRFYALNSDGHIRLGCKIRCKDDIAALAEGEKLSHDSPVEIWQGGRMVATVTSSLSPVSHERPERANA